MTKITTVEEAGLYLTGQKLEGGNHHVVVAQSLRFPGKSYAVKELSLDECVGELLSYNLLQACYVAVPEEIFIVELAKDRYALVSLIVGTDVKDHLQECASYQRQGQDRRYLLETAFVHVMTGDLRSLDGRRRMFVDGLYEALVPFIFTSDESPLGPSLGNIRLVQRKNDLLCVKIDPANGYNPLNCIHSEDDQFSEKFMRYLTDPSERSFKHQRWFILGFDNDAGRRCPYMTFSYSDAIHILYGADKVIGLLSHLQKIIEESLPEGYKKDFDTREELVLALINLYKKRIAQIEGYARSIQDLPYVESRPADFKIEIDGLTNRTVVDLICARMAMCDIPFYLACSRVMKELKFFSYSLKKTEALAVDSLVAGRPKTAEALYFSQQALHQAALQELDKRIREILSESYRPALYGARCVYSAGNIFASTNQNGDTIFHVLAKRGNLLNMQEMLDYLCLHNQMSSAPLRLRCMLNNEGYSPLQIAEKKQDDKMLEAILRYEDIARRADPARDRLFVDLDLLSLDPREIGRQHSLFLSCSAMRALLMIDEDGQSPLLQTIAEAIAARNVGSTDSLALMFRNFVREVMRADRSHDVINISLSYVIDMQVQLDRQRVSLA